MHTEHERGKRKIAVAFPICTCNAHIRLRLTTRLFVLWLRELRLVLLYTLVWAALAKLGI